MSQHVARFARLALAVYLGAPASCCPQPAASATTDSAASSAAASSAAASSAAASPAAAAPAAVDSTTASATAPTAASPAWNDRARFLAGLPVADGSPLAKLEQTSEWKSHQKTLDEDWLRLGARLESMSRWARAEVDGHVDPELPLLYLFGGPDVDTAITLFPRARSYLLAGLEPVGRVSAPESLSPEALHEALDALSYSLRTTVRTSFFRTDEMGHDLSGRQKREIKGVLPIALLFLARAGAQIIEVQRLEIDALTGVASVRAETDALGPGIPAVRVTFRRENAPEPQTLTYVRADLINDSLAKTPGFASFFRTFTPGNALLKAASFILYDRNFSTTRGLLLAGAASVLQEDSGIPYRFFKKDSWDTTCFGTYAAPRHPFEKNYQPDLASACAAQPARALPFVIGYRRASDTNLFLAVKKAAVAGDATAETRQATVPASTPSVSPAPAPAPATSTGPALAPSPTAVPASKQAAAPGPPAPVPVGPTASATTGTR